MQKHVSSGHHTALAFAAVLLFSSLSFAQALNWQPQNETFNQLGCESRIKFNMASGVPAQMALTGDSNIDPYITSANQLVGTPNFSKTQEYSWDVQPHEDGPAELRVDSYFTTNGYQFDVSQSLSQPRTSSYNFAFTREVAYGDNSIEIDVTQDLDIDKNCKATLYDTAIRYVRIQRPRLFYWQDQLQRGATAGTIRKTTVQLPSDGPLIFHEHLSLPALEKLTSSLKVFYIIGHFEAPIVSVDHFADHVAQRYDPVANRMTGVAVIDATLNVADIHVPLSFEFSKTSAFKLISQDGDKIWYVPLALWLKGHVPQPGTTTTATDGQAVRYQPGAFDSDEPTSVVVETNALAFSHYDHFSLYWRIANTSDPNGETSFNLVGGGAVRLSDYAKYPRWMAPAHSSYLDGSNMVQTDLPYIKSMASEALQNAGPSANNAKLAATIIAAIHKRFQYDHGAVDVGGNVQYMPTSDIVKRKYLTCDNFATLFAAIARSLGIPTRIIVGAYIGDSVGYHAWNEIEIADNVWIPVDATDDIPLFYTGNYLPFLALEHDSVDASVLPFMSDSTKYSVIVNKTEPNEL